MNITEKRNYSEKAMEVSIANWQKVMKMLLKLKQISNGGPIVTVPATRILQGRILVEYMC